MEVTPALVDFTELLVLPCAALESLVEAELSTNDALERIDAGECPICRGARSTRCPVCSAPRRSRPQGAGGDVGNQAAAEPDTHALLRAVRLETTAAEAPIAEFVVDSLDEHGRLDRSCAEIATELGVPESAVVRVVGVVREIGAPGVGATSVTDCLLLQLDALALDDDCARLARAVIADHLPALARGRFASIAKALGVSRAEIEDVAFTVELVEPALMRLGIRSDRRAASDGSLARAKAFLAHLHDRWDTLRRVAEYTVERQQGFLVAGETALVPLTRSEVAAALDLHESTVSRAVADKFALLPDGTTIPLSRFFGVSGGVDGELRKLLDSADGPISDQRLADLLRDVGYPIARRTVAKHRARLGFAASPLR